MDFSRYDGYEVTGSIVRSTTDAFRLFPDIALKTIAKHGIGKTGLRGELILEEEWYPLAPWLECFVDIEETVGGSKMFEIGKHVPKNAALPKTINDISSALASLDVAYHMNHRKSGRVMFDPATGAKTDGIGHFLPTVEKDRNRITLVADDVPYPCNCDRGIILGFATRFEPKASVTHPLESGCRRKGDRSCTYVVEW
ncbi:MAG TPA: hypothetical protein VGP93_20970 [Polyangiaceae bacterium]|nr:hypothetical protein [Polyangiaceae bacterium]